MDRMYKQVARGLKVLADDAALSCASTSARTATLKGNRTHIYSAMLLHETAGMLSRSQSAALDRLRQTAEAMLLPAASTTGASGNETDKALAELGVRILDAISRKD